MTSARYTYLTGDQYELSALMDHINEFCTKYPEYRLHTLFPSPVPKTRTMIALMTTDPA